MTSQHQQPRIAWHYTTGQHLPKIIQSKKLRLEVGISISKGERMAVWFTTADRYEPTALKAQIQKDGSKYDFQTAAEQAPHTQGLVRIGVDAKRLLTYDQWLDRSRVHPLQLKGMEQAASLKGVDCHRLWYVSFKPIQQNAWLAIETSDDDEVWTPWDGFEQLGGRGF